MPVIISLNFQTPPTVPAVLSELFVSGVKFNCVVVIVPDFICSATIAPAEISPADIVG